MGQHLAAPRAKGPIRGALELLLSGGDRMKVDGMFFSAAERRAIHNHSLVFQFGAAAGYANRTSNSLDIG